MPGFRTPLPALLAATLQGGMNAVLALDPNSIARVRRLEGRVLKLVLEGVAIDLFFTARNQAIDVSLQAPGGDPVDAEDQPDTVVSGTPGALFSMAASELNEGWSAPGSKVNISGDAALARDFERLFSRLDPDIEAALAALFGDVVGHQVAFGLRQGARRARETANTAGEVFGEVMREGARGGRSGPLIGSDEYRRFADGVDELRDAVDRLEARLRILDSTAGDGETEAP